MATKIQKLGQYQLVSKLGEGGMGAVFKAYHPHLDRYVAIKILPKKATINKELIERFSREAKAAAKLEHPNIVQVYDFGHDKGLYYIVLQYIQGESLANLLERRGPLPLGEAAAILQDSLQGLGKAHSLGIVHRDIKPDNILISKNGEVKVADFGIAKMKNDTSKITMTGQIIGTPHYMSPEQCQALPIDARSDIYSLGATFYTMLAGSPPFNAELPLAILNMHVNTPPPDVRTIRPDVPEYIAKIILKMMAKQPQDRFQSCREVLLALSCQQPPQLTSTPPSPNPTPNISESPTLSQTASHLTHQQALPSSNQTTSTPIYKNKYALITLLITTLLLSLAILSQKSKPQHTSTTKLKSPKPTSKTNQKTIPKTPTNTITTATTQPTTSTTTQTPTTQRTASPPPLLLSKIPNHTYAYLYLSSPSTLLDRAQFPQLHSPQNLKKNSKKILQSLLQSLEKKYKLPLQSLQNYTLNLELASLSPKPQWKHLLLAIRLENPTQTKHLLSKILQKHQAKHKSHHIYTFHHNQNFITQIQDHILLSGSFSLLYQLKNPSKTQKKLLHTLQKYKLPLPHQNQNLLLWFYHIPQSKLVSHTHLKLPTRLELPSNSPQGFTIGYIRENGLSSLSLFSAKPLPIQKFFGNSTLPNTQLKIFPRALSSLLLAHNPQTPLKQKKWTKQLLLGKNKRKQLIWKPLHQLLLNASPQTLRIYALKKTQILLLLHFSQTSQANQFLQNAKDIFPYHQTLEPHHLLFPKNHMKIIQNSQQIAILLSKNPRKLLKFSPQSLSKYQNQATPAPNWIQKYHPALLLTISPNHPSIAKFNLNEPLYLAISSNPPYLHLTTNYPLLFQILQNTKQTLFPPNTSSNQTTSSSTQLTDLQIQKLFQNAHHYIQQYRQQHNQLPSQQALNQYFQQQLHGYRFHLTAPNTIIRTLKKRIENLKNLKRKFSYVAPRKKWFSQLTLNYLQKKLNQYLSTYLLGLLPPNPHSPSYLSFSSKPELVQKLPDSNKFWQIFQQEKKKFQKQQEKQNLQRRNPWRRRFFR